MTRYSTPVFSPSAVKVPLPVKVWTLYPDLEEVLVDPPDASNKLYATRHSDPS
jgi:hypothetical protein